MTQLEPWFWADGSLDRSAVGRSLSLIPDDKLQRKVALLHVLLSERPDHPQRLLLPVLNGMMCLRSS